MCAESAAARLESTSALASTDARSLSNTLLLNESLTLRSTAPATDLTPHPWLRPDNPRLGDGPRPNGCWSLPPVIIDGLPQQLPKLPGFPAEPPRTTPQDKLPTLPKPQEQTTPAPENRTWGAPDPNDTILRKVGREALVLGGGLGEATLYGISHLPEKLPSLASSVAIGAALNAISKTGKTGMGAAMLVGAYFTSRYVMNAWNDTERWSKFGHAVKDTWDSDQYTWKNMHDVASTGGAFAVDTGLSMAAGYVGYKNQTLADFILKVIKLPIPVPVGPVPPALLETSMVMAIVPPVYQRFHTNMNSNANLPFDNLRRTPGLGSGWDFDLHWSLRRAQPPDDQASDINRK